MRRYPLEKIDKLWDRKAIINYPDLKKYLITDSELEMEKEGFKKGRRKC